MNTEAAHTKLTVMLTPRSMSALSDSASLAGDTMTNTVNRALQLWALLELELATDGELWLVRTVPARRPWWLWLLGPFALWFSSERRVVQRLNWRQPKAESTR